MFPWKKHNQEVDAAFSILKIINWRISKFQLITILICRDESMDRSI